MNKLLRVLSINVAISYMIEQGLYGAYILENYYHKEVDEIATLIDNKRNNLFTYSGLDLLSQRYLIRSHQHVLLESPQEMYIGIAMHLAMKETNDRIGWDNKSKPLYVNKLLRLLSINVAISSTSL